MKKQLLFLTFVLPSLIFAQYSQDDVYNYIDKYHRLAIEMMKETKIPASIKLAQSIYSSGAGTTSLAKNSQNHFGILCGNDWEGDRYTDPANQICYRKYKTVEEAYQDHTDFLKSRSRYNRLFFLDILDYNAWANALQEAGYSANPKYAQNIIEIIETYYLHIYDKEGENSNQVAGGNNQGGESGKQKVESRKVEEKTLSSEATLAAENRKQEEALAAERERIEREKQEKLRLEQETKAKEEEKAKIELAWNEFDAKEKARILKGKDDFEAKIEKDRKAFEERQRIQHEINVKSFADSLKTEIPENLKWETLAVTPVISKADTILFIKQTATPVKIETIRKDTIIESGIEVIINRPVKNQATSGSNQATGGSNQATGDRNQVAENRNETETSFTPHSNNKTTSVEEILVFKAKEFEYKPVYYAFTTRNVYENNKTKFVIAQRGDTYAKIAKEVQLPESKLREYNELFDDAMYEPATGEVVYISVKNSKSYVQTHTVQKGETMRYIAQKYAVPLKMIYKRNGLSTDAFAEGKTICITCKK